jgi:DnaJ-class molecular chaperone
VESFRQLWEFTYRKEIAAHCEVLHLSYPFTSEDLKGAYRKLVFETHPDHGGTEEKFRPIQTAYEYLQSYVHERITQEELEKTTWARIKIEEQEPFKNFVDCPACQGKGRWIEKIHEKVGYKTVAFPCSRCGGDGKHKLVCRSCKGTGKYVQKNGREVPCHKCGGTGKFAVGVCYGCSGTGMTFIDIPSYSPREVKYERECFTCKGTGKKEILNPVLKKGVVGTGRAR